MQERNRVMAAPPHSRVGMLETHLAAVFGWLLGVWPITQLWMAEIYSSTVPGVVLALPIITLMAKQMLIRENRISYNMVLLAPVYVFYGAIVCSSLYSPNIAGAFEELIKMSINVGVYFSVTAVLSTSNHITERIWNRFILARALICLVLFARYMLVFKVGYVGVNLSYPITTGKNALGLFATAAIPLALSWMRSIRKTYSIVIIMIILATTVLTLSRGAWISSLIGALVAYFIGSRRGSHLRGILSVMVIAIVLLLFLRVAPIDTTSLQARFKILQDLAGSDVMLTSSDSARWRFIIRGLIAFAESPVWGHGLSSYIPLIGQGWQSHNDYVLILSEQGLLGIFPFLFMVFSHFLVGLNLSRRNPQWTTVGLTGSFAGLCTYLMLINAYTGVLFWAIMGSIHAALVRETSRL